MSDRPSAHRTAPAQPSSSPASPASRRVLPTLNNDGSRNWCRPKTFKGRYYWRRFAVAWGLIATFVILPFVNVGGHPAILLDIPKRRFHLMGATFLPTEGVLLMFLMLALLISVFWVTALWGRAWCGWACPQTAYLEFVFRPIEQFLEGSRGQQLKLDREGPNARRILKFAIYAVLSVIVANVFLSYFVGVEALRGWLTQSPLNHPTPFIVVAITSGMVLLDFAYFREQMCTVVCPYARLQSALLDKKSLIVGYDAKRGEPRGKGRNEGGDCIDCKACVVACPTGIDIRDGLQLECVACTQCIDACDGVMAKIKKPLGLIRYSSQNELETGSEGREARPRVWIYPIAIVAFLGAMVFLAKGRTGVDVTLLRGIGAPFVAQGDQIRNQIRIKLYNKADEAVTYTLSLSEAGASTFIAPENPITVPAGTQVTTTAFIVSPLAVFTHGQRAIELKVSSDQHTVTSPYKLLGPMNTESPQ